MTKVLEIVGFADSRFAPPDQDGFMSSAIAWSENDESEYAGELELTEHGISLTAVSGGNQSQASREICFDDVANIYLECCAPAKHAWEPALVFVTLDGDRVAIGAPQGPEALHELADEIMAAYRKKQEMV